MKHQPLSIPWIWPSGHPIPNKHQINPYVEVILEKFSQTGWLGDKIILGKLEIRSTDRSQRYNIVGSILALHQENWTSVPGTTYGGGDL